MYCALMSQLQFTAIPIVYNCTHAGGGEVYPRREAGGARGVQHCPLPCLELRRLDRGQAETKRPALPSENMHRRAKCFIIIIFFFLF